MTRVRRDRAVRRARLVVTATAALATAGVVGSPAPASAAGPARLASPATAVQGTVGSPASAALEAELEGSASLRRELRAAFGSSADEVSVAVRDRRTGAVFTYNPGLTNCTGSIVKVMVLTAIIRDRRAGGRFLSAGQQRLAERMIRFSDNDATTSLLRQAGGRSALDRVARAAGMTSTRSAGSWGRTATTAPDQLRLMDALVAPRSTLLSARDRAYVLRLMGRVSPEQRWGVGRVPAGVRAQVKNGWVPLSPKGWRVNSIGHASGAGRDYTMAVLSYRNASMGEGVRHVNDASRIVGAHLSRSRGASVRPAVSGSAAASALSRASVAALSQPRPIW
ncbi:serine hydrolase [Agilicoccus flavus]|uniref:serine hydrolase n=1 Tax=Agilicoccus flavus TaxID=2775968 RepID=UPI001CF60713|nr:serine hydrolase [Agilicoccus flavus]